MVSKKNELIEFIPGNGWNVVSVLSFELLPGDSLPAGTTNKFGFASCTGRRNGSTGYTRSARLTSRTVMYSTMITNNKQLHTMTINIVSSSISEMKMFYGLRQMLWIDNLIPRVSFLFFLYTYLLSASSMFQKSGRNPGNEASGKIFAWLRANRKDKNLFHTRCCDFQSTSVNHISFVQESGKQRRRREKFVRYQIF